MATTQTAASVTGAAAPAAAAATAFRANTQKTIKRPGVVLSTVLGAAPIPLADTQLPPTTLLRCIYMEVTCVTATNAV